MKIRLKQVKSIAKKAALLGGAYLIAKLAFSAPIFYDYFKENRERIKSGQTAQNLNINEYTLKINGLEKHLALAGEQHDYNENEHKIAESLVKQYRNIASEPGFSRKGMTVKNRLFWAKMIIPVKIVNFYQHLGNGRWYLSISRTAAKQGRKVYELEPVNEPVDLLKKDFKECMAMMYSKGAFSLKGPRDEYEFAKGEDIAYASLPRQDSIPSDDDGFGSPKRERVMAENIIALLEKDGVDSLLATAGNKHIRGILKYISENKEVQIIGLEPKNSYRKK